MAQEKNKLNSPEQQVIWTLKDRLPGVTHPNWQSLDFFSPLFPYWQETYTTEKNDNFNTNSTSYAMRKI